MFSKVQPIQWNVFNHQRQVVKEYLSKGVISVIQLVIIKLGYRTKTGGYRWKVSYYSIDRIYRELPTC